MKKVQLFILVLLILTGCTAKIDTATQAEYKKITADEAALMMTEEVVILDVRTQEEFDAGHIENAVLLPDYEVEARASEILPDKEQTILIYCRTGRRSANAAKALIAMGYTAVYDFGGLETDWNGEVLYHSYRFTSRYRGNII